MIQDIVDKTNLLDLLERLIVALRAVSDAAYISKEDQITIDLSNYYTKSEVNNLIGSGDVVLGTTPLTVEGGVWVEWS